MSQSDKQALRERFGTRLFAPASEVAIFVGWYATRQSAHNAIYRGHFPVPVRRLANRTVVRLADVAAWFDDEPTEPPRPRGRPTKAEQMARRAREGVES